MNPQVFPPPQDSLVDCPCSMINWYYFEAQARYMDGRYNTQDGIPARQLVLALKKLLDSKKICLAFEIGCRLMLASLGSIDDGDLLTADKKLAKMERLADQSKLAAEEMEALPRLARWVRHLKEEIFAKRDADAGFVVSTGVLHSFYVRPLPDEEDVIHDTATFKCKDPEEDDGDESSGLDDSPTW